jgi:sigma-B regulation protein RsbU (phosphoserine phosphatase)
VRLQLEAGDTLALFSDGVSEAVDTKQEMFGVPRLRELYVGQHEATLDHLQKIALDALESFTRGASQADDITLLLVRYRPPEQGSAS